VEAVLIETVRYQDAILAIIVTSSYRKPGVNFCTPDNFSQQLAFIRHGKGKIIEAHVHNPVLREVFLTQEVLHIIKGRLRVDFYDDEKIYIESRILITGDTIVLVSGGHGFEVLEETEMIEVKQGPYVGDGDKTRFPGISSSDAIIPEQKKNDTR
jgi:mannose-6-phosphate isomerase-like protein (cupin superfamily)